ADGHDGSDVIMFCTDGIFTLEPRTTGVGHEFGQWEYKGCATDVLLLQPGVWYSPAGAHRTRGYGAKRAEIITATGSEPLTYHHLIDEWREYGTSGSIKYRETRFVGLGGCVGRGHFNDYARWLPVERVLRFAPERKFAPRHMADSLPLYLYDMMDQESEPY